MPEMMALRAHVRGGAAGLRFELAPRPTLEPGDVLVQVNAAGITFAEFSWDETWTRDGVDRTPTIPSHEVSGVVVEGSAEAADYPIGTRVFGLVPFDRNGAAAHYVAVPASSLAIKPPEVSDVIAAAAPMTTLTALQALTTHAQCKPGDTVLVHGAAGSVGGLVTQLGKSLGAHVTGTCRARDRDLVLELGADTVIDFEAEPFDARPDRYDIVVDTVGGDTLDRSYAVVRTGGHLVTLQAPPSREKADRYDITAIFFIVTADHGQLTEIATLIREDRLRITVSETYPLADGRTAYLRGGERLRPSGKTVLLVDR